jgi:hypothetical protein
MDLFEGLSTAFGTGEGRWVKRPLRPEDFASHLLGQGPGIGIAPLRPDSTVMFAAIDLDEPDFAAAFEMQGYIPGTSFVERSRSGNAHVWVFFSEPLEAWVAMGVLKEAVLAAGKQHVEIFPKNHDFERVKLGNYINLPYHGSERPIVEHVDTVVTDEGGVRIALTEDLSLEKFVHEALGSRNHPEDWRRKARWLLISPPDQRERSAEFGQQATLHQCADYVLSGEAGIIHHGHQNAVLFMLAKCLTNWREVDHEEALDLLRTAVDSVFDPKPSDSEVRRILGNVERAQYTSTGCDDPLVLPFSHPECPISHPRS